ncbi:DUF732 domain-containing protein, partial [Pseudonocardia hydrocarbonoxydans]|uniref:DUF732 domain-containing protein n=1 Tax=Pseudonocardia hydrocarbonoxydans TaxID=76726 RepID=UPI0031D131D8
AAVQADAELGVTGRPDLGDPLAVGVGTHPAPPWAAGPRHGAPEDPFHPGPPLADPAPDTDVLHHVVPAPRPEPARHAAPADAAYPDAAHPDDAPVAPGGRAERRRSAAETTVFSEPLVVDEPVTELVDATAVAQDPAEEQAEDEQPLVAAGRRRRAAADPDDDRYENDDDAPTTGASATGGRPAARRARRGLFRRRAPRLAAGAAVGALALAGVVWLNSGADTMEPAAVVEAAAPAVPQLPAAAATDAGADAPALSQGDPLSERGTEFLAALREAGVPTSQGGAAETEAAELVCGELADGVDEARIARALPASLPSVTRAEAADLVDIAQETYCTT